MRTEPAAEILGTFLHVKDGGRADMVPVSESFWQELADGAHPRLEQGRLLSAFTFSEPWSVTVPTTLLFLTPGAGTEHRPV